MARDVYFFDQSDGKPYWRRGGNKIEPLAGFLLQEDFEGKKKPLTHSVLTPAITMDGSYVLFLRGEWAYQVYTARVLRKDGTFLPPKASEGLICRPYIGILSTRKA